MANEFVARNGIIALDSSTITGSLNVSGIGSFVNNVTANGFVKSGGTSAQILAADGTVITAGTNITISGGTISSTGGSSTSGDKITTGSISASVNLGAATFQLISASSTFLFVSSSGNVGVNTTSSTAQLEVRKSAQTKPNIILSGPNNFNADDFRGLAITNYYSDATLTNKQLAIYNADSINYPYLRVSIANLNYVSVDAVTGSTAGTKDLYVNNAIYITSGSNVGIGTLVPTAKLQVSGSSNVVNFRGSGSVATSSIFTVDGAAGRLFSVNDSLSGSLFSVNTIAGLPVMEAFSDNIVRIGQYGQKVLYVSQSRIGMGTETPTALLHMTSSTGTILEIDGPGGINIMNVSASGRIGISTATPLGRFDVSYGGNLNDPTIIVGADEGSSSRTNNTTKIARIGIPHYNNSATSSAVLIADSNVTANRVFIGGGSAFMNAANSIFFYTAETTASLTGTARMFISSSGNVGIGTTTPLLTLDVSGSFRATNTSSFSSTLNISGSLSVGLISPSATVGRIDASNDVVAFSTSDKRFKNNITPIKDALNKINKIGGYEFDWNEENKIHHGYEGHDLGVIAQEIEAIAPELVQNRASGYKAVKYDKLISVLIEAIKELSDKVDKLEKQIKL